MIESMTSLTKNKNKKTKQKQKQNKPNKQTNKKPTTTIKPTNKQTNKKTLRVHMGPSKTPMKHRGYSGVVTNILGNLIEFETH